MSHANSSKQSTCTPPPRTMRVRVARALPKGVRPPYPCRDRYGSQIVSRVTCLFSCPRSDTCRCSMMRRDSFPDTCARAVRRRPSALRAGVSCACRAVSRKRRRGSRVKSAGKSRQEAGSNASPKPVLPKDGWAIVNARSVERQVREQN